LVLWAGLACGAVVAFAGGIALSGSGLVATTVAGAVAAALAAGAARESSRGSRPAVVDAAWKSAAGTVVGLLLVSGLVVLAGGVVATLVTGLALAGALGLWLRARHRPGAAARHRPVAGRPRPAAAPPAPLSSVRGGGSERGLLPVSVLPTPVLGREWLHSTAALAGRLEPRVRQLIVRRREEALDELERRDPDGFARWLAAGPSTDPSRFVRGDVRGEAAGTDAA
jgi:hypothetical protein